MFFFFFKCMITFEPRVRKRGTVVASTVVTFLNGTEHTLCFQRVTALSVVETL